MTVLLLSVSVVFVDTHDGSNITPFVNSTPVVNTSAPKQQFQNKMFVPFILLAIVIIAIIIVAVILFTNSQSQKTSQSTIPVSQTPPVNLKTGYQNPFDRSDKYVNPFENIK